MKKQIKIATLLAWLYSACAWSTPQVLDELLYEGQTRPILEFPLSDYFERQQSYPKIFSAEGIQTSANWRGHQAKWEIREGALYLTAVEKLYGDPRDSKTLEWKDITSRVFPDRDLPMPASWYTGVIRIGDGKQLECLPVGIDIYEREIHIRLKEGRVTGVKVHPNKEEPAMPCK